MYYTYILYSKTIDKYYIGQTGNLEDRLNRHNTRNTGYTSKGKPWTLVNSEKFKTRKEAILRETQLKRLKSKTLIQRISQANE